MGIGDRYFSSGKYRIPIMEITHQQKTLKIRKKLYEILKKVSFSSGFENTFL